MPVTVYRWDDVGAPQLQGQSVGSLITVLDACLVNGYGSKAPSGWTKPFSGANLAAYKQGGGCGFYLRVNDTQATQGRATAFGCEVMYNIFSYGNLFPTAVQLSSGVNIEISNYSIATTQPWIVVADEKRFYLWIGSSFSSSAAALSTSVNGQSLFFFGDIISFKQNDPYCCQIIGAYSSLTMTETFGRINSLGATTNGHCTARNAAADILSVGNSKVSDYYGNGSQTTIGRSGSIAYPDPISGALNLSRILLSNGTITKGIRGRLPGAWAPLHALPGANGDTFSGVGELAGREFILLDCATDAIRGRVAIETSNTWD